MNYLAPNEIIKIWETGKNQHLLDRALTILSYTNHEMTWDYLIKLTIGQRDRMLLEFREKVFGPNLEGFACCPNCSESLEINMSTNDFLRQQESKISDNAEFLEFSVDNLNCKSRLPNSLDLAAVLACKDVNDAFQLLVKRCLVNITSDGKNVETDQLSASIIDKLGTVFVESEPYADIMLDLKCPACNHNWQMSFDILTFLWNDISSYAKNLLWEIHTIASAYKWSENEILSMSSIRRKHYMEMLI